MLLLLLLFCCSVIVAVVFVIVVVVVVVFLSWTLWESYVICNCRLTNAFRRVRGLRVFVYIYIFFLLPLHMGSLTPSSEDLFPFLEGGVCYSRSFLWLTMFPNNYASHHIFAPNNYAAHPIFPK